MLYVLCMLCVGFLEEIIFRGLLFLAMYKDTPRAAIAVSSITFGIGHIINLINGSGADLLSNLLQVAYASAAGFMFVMIFVRSESLLACIVAHGVFNALSAFCPDPDTVAVEILSALALILVSGAYGLWLVLMPWVGKGTQERAHASPYNRDNKNAEDAQR